MTAATTDASALQALAGTIAAADAEVAASVDPSAGDPAAAPAEVAPVDQGAEFAAVLAMGVAMLTPALPFLPDCYTPAACERIGVAFAAVAEKRGWNIADLMTPEVALLIAAAPPTAQAVMAGRAHFAAQRQAQAEAQAKAQASQQGAG